MVNVPILMRRLRAPSTLAAAWMPADIPGVGIWVPTHLLASMSTDDGETTKATAAGDEIFHVDEAIQNLDIDAEASTRRPFVQADGSLLFGNIAATVRAMRAQNTMGSFNSIHTLGIGTIMVGFKLNNVGDGGMLLDNCGFQGGGGQLNGFYLRVVGGTGAIEFGIDKQSVARPLSIVTSAVANNTNFNTVVVRLGGVGANQISVQLNNNTPTAGTPNTDLGTGNANYNLSIGARNVSWPSVNFTGQIYQPVICSTLVGEDDIAKWKVYNPPLQ